MKTWPLTSTSEELDCSAALVAMVWAVSVSSAVFRILIFSIFCLLSCFSISFRSWGVNPSLPIHRVGFSSLSTCRTWRFILVVILVRFGFLLFLF